MKKTIFLTSMMMTLAMTQQSFAGFDLGVVKISSSGIEVRKPDEAVKAALRNANPAEHIKNVAEVIQKNTGGDVSKAAGSVAKEAGRTVQTMEDAGSSAVEVTKETLKNPKKGLPRLMACSATACLSEVQAKRQMAEEERELKKQREADLEKYKQNQTAEAKKQIEADYAKTKTELAEAQEHLDVFQTTSNALIQIEVALEGRTELNQEIAAQVSTVSTPENQKLLHDYIGFIAKMESDEAGSKEFSAQAATLEAQLTATAETAQISTEDFLQRVVEGLNANQAEEIAAIVMSVKLPINESVSFFTSEVEYYKAQISAYESALGLTSTQR